MVSSQRAAQNSNTKGSDKGQTWANREVCTRAEHRVTTTHRLRDTGRHQRACSIHRHTPTISSHLKSQSSGCTDHPPASQSTIVVSLTSCNSSLPTFRMPQLLHCVQELFCAFTVVEHLSVIGVCLSTGWYLCRSAKSLSCCRLAPSRLEHDFFCRDNELSSPRIRHCETSLHNFPRPLRLKHVVDTTGVSTSPK